MFQGTPTRFRPPRPSRPPMSWNAAGVSRPTATGQQRPWWAGGGTHQMQTRSPGGQQINPQGQPYSGTAQANAQAGYGMRTDDMVGSPAEAYRPLPAGYNPSQGLPAGQQYPTGPNGPLAVAWGQQAGQQPGAGTAQYNPQTGASTIGGQVVGRDFLYRGPPVGQQPSPYLGDRTMQGQQQYPMGPNGPLAALWGQQPQSGGTTINSGFNPQPLFSPQQTETAANQIQNQGIQSAYSAGNQFGLPGFASYSPTVLSRAGAAAGQSMAQAGAGAEQLRMGDRLANQQNILAGQLGRASDFIGQGSNIQAFQGMNQDYSNQAAGGLMSAIQGQLGGINNDFQTGLGDRTWQAGMGLGAQQLGANNWLQQMQMMNQMMDFRNLNPQQQPMLSAMQWA